MMPAPFSKDLRWRVIWFVHVLQHSVAEASLFLGVSERTIERYISKFLVTGDVKSETINRPFIRGNKERLSIEKSVSFFCLRRQEPSDKRSYSSLPLGRF